jgi:hypothetical protein
MTTQDTSSPAYKWAREQERLEEKLRIERATEIERLKALCKQQHEAIETYSKTGYWNTELLEEVLAKYKEFNK